jgi:hypothetical protein
MLDINKQKMKYALQGQTVTIEETDEYGNPVYEGYTDASGNFIPYLDSQGNPIPKTKEVSGFSEPVTFYANISNKLSEVLVKQFGIDDSTSYVQICTDKGYLPIKAGSVIWKKSEVTLKDNGLPDEDSADYVVKGVADEGLTADLFLLQKVVK